MRSSTAKSAQTPGCKANLRGVSESLGDLPSPLFRWQGRARYVAEIAELTLSTPALLVILSPRVPRLLTGISPFSDNVRSP